MCNIIQLSILAIVLLVSSLHTASAKELSKVQTNYMLQCQGCHKADGSGMPPQTPDFREYASTFLETDIGRRYWISVPGAANSPLTNAELAEVLNYIAIDIVKIKNHRAFTSDEVKQHRGEKMKNVYEVRQNIANALHADHF